MRVLQQLLPYNDRLAKRDPARIRMIVLHCTELPTLQQAREFGEKIVLEDGTGHSGHYYVDRNGDVLRYVDDDRVAHHVVGHNQESIGIELVNTGRYPDWFFAEKQNFQEPYPDQQIAALKTLLRELRKKYPAISEIARHSDLDTRWIPAEDDPQKQVRRRLDPGPLFPWVEILEWWKSGSQD